MVNWLVPTSSIMQRDFMDLSGFYRKFIKGYASLAYPVTTLLRKDALLWYPKAQTTFESLKKSRLKHLSSSWLKHFLRHKLCIHTNHKSLKELIWQVIQILKQQYIFLNFIVFILLFLESLMLMLMAFHGLNFLLIVSHLPCPIFTYGMAWLLTSNFIHFETLCHNIITTPN